MPLAPCTLPFDSLDVLIYKVICRRIGKILVGSMYVVGNKLKVASVLRSPSPQLLLLLWLHPPLLYLGSDNVTLDTLIFH